MAREGYAKLKHKQRIEALDLAKKNEIITSKVLEKQQETNDDLKLDLSKRITT